METVVQLVVAVVVGGALVWCGWWLGKDLSALAGGNELDLSTRARAALQRKLKRLLLATGTIVAVGGCLAAVFAPAWLYLAVLMGIPSVALVWMYRAVNTDGSKQ